MADTRTEVTDAQAAAMWEAHKAQVDATIARRRKNRAIERTNSAQVRRRLHHELKDAVERAMAIRESIAYYGEPDEYREAQLEALDREIGKLLWLNRRAEGKAFHYSIQLNHRVEPELNQGLKIELTKEDDWPQGWGEIDFYSRETICRITGDLSHIEDWLLEADQRDTYWMPWRGEKP